MSALALATRPNANPPSIHIYVDDDQQRIFVQISGPATATLVCDHVCRLFRGRPALAAYDMLYDLSDYTGDVTGPDIDPIVDAYADCRADVALPVRTAFLTYDRHFQHWATAMDAQFAGREHRAFPKLGAALSFLDTPTTERRPGLS
jgi:hypothetical protein